MPEPSSPLSPSPDAPVRRPAAGPRAGPALPLRLSVGQAAAAILIAAAATIGGALIFEHGFGLLPCKLCLVQRYPYYVAIPIAFVAALAPARAARVGLTLLAVVFLASAGLGLYHAGVEWGFFAGPSDCGGAMAQSAGSVGDFLKQLETTRIVSCTEAAWRFLGLSLAGWNVVISLCLVGLALWPLLADAPAHPQPGHGSE